MNKLLLAILFAGLNIVAKAQSDFSATTIVLTTHDTLSVLVKKFNRSPSPKEIQYRTSESPQLISLNAKDAIWFRLNEGEWFFSYEEKSTAIFVQLISKGKANLYSSHDESSQLHLYYSKDDGAISEFINEKTPDNSVVYKNQLKQIFSDCAGAEKIISSCKDFSVNSFARAFDDYNDCAGKNAGFSQSKVRGGFELSGQLGINSTGLNMSGPSLNASNLYTSTISFDRSFGFQAGLGFNWIVPHLQQKLHIYNDALIRNYSMNGTGTGSFKDEDIFVKAVYLKIITLFRYQINHGVVRPFFECGMSNSFALSHQTSDQYIFKDFRTYEQGLVIGAGARWKSWDTELRFETTNGFTEYVGLKTHFNTWYLQFGYIF